MSLQAVLTVTNQTAEQSSLKGQALQASMTNTAAMFERQVRQLNGSAVQQTHLKQVDQAVKKSMQQTLL